MCPTDNGITIKKNLISVKYKPIAYVTRAQGFIFLLLKHYNNNNRTKINIKELDRKRRIFFGNESA